MQANLQRYLIALSFGLRFALAVANGAAQHYPESLPAVSPVPPTAPAGSGGTARAATDRSPGRGVSGRVFEAPPLTLYHLGSALAPTRGGLPIARRSSIHTFGMRRGACCGSTPGPGRQEARLPAARGNGGAARRNRSQVWAGGRRAAPGAEGLQLMQREALG